MTIIFKEGGCWTTADLCLYVQITEQHRREIADTVRTIPLTKRLFAILERRNVLVQTEQISRVVTGLDGAEPVPGPARICRTDARCTLIAQEVNICARITLS